MGSFAGHILPGTFFLLFAFWHAIGVFNKYFKLLARSRPDPRSLNGFSTPLYKPTASFRLSVCSNHPIEGFVKVGACTIGMIGEFITAFKDGKFTHLGNAQHMTMFFFFGLNGMADILLHYGAPIPSHSDFFTMALACFIEGLLFYFHLHGRTHLDIHIHQLLIIAIAVSFLAVLAEWRYHHVLSSLLRVLCTFIQGSWFYQIGFVLYPPLGLPNTWQENDHEQMMLITAYFCWHVAGDLLIMFIIGFYVYLIYRPQILINQNKLNALTLKALDDEEDEEDDDFDAEATIPMRPYERDEDLVRVDTFLPECCNKNGGPPAHAYLKANRGKQKRVRRNKNMLHDAGDDQINIKSPSDRTKEIQRIPNGMQNGGVNQATHSNRQIDKHSLLNSDFDDEEL